VSVLPAVDVFLAWSGWFFALVGTAASVEGLRRAARESRRSNRMAEALGARAAPAPSSAASSTPSPSGAPSAPRTPSAAPAAVRPPRGDDQIRSFLVHAAAGNQPLSVPMRRANRMGFGDDEVMAMAAELRRGGLLEYGGELAPDTRLGLRQ
jgi:hypothetical protein